jgi:GNAT superfamily N-acetyltransferase
MLAVDFSTMSDLQHKEKLVTMMQALYAEDKSDFPVDQSRFGITVECLAANPSQGRIVLFRQGELLCGYALLIPYWSNEFGGTVLFVDEMFVIPEARNRGIGRSFFKFLDHARPFEAVALALEVSPGNSGALRLYESIGFRRQRNFSLIHRFTGDPTKGL